MESDAAGRDVILAARNAPYHPAVALLTAFPEDDWEDMGADKMLVKPMQTAILIKQIEKLLETHAAKLQRLATSTSAPASAAPATTTSTPASKAAKKAPASKAVPKPPAPKKSAAKKPELKKPTAKPPVARKKVATKKRKR